jgi:hypothetical protein
MSLAAIRQDGLAGRTTRDALARYRDSPEALPPVRVDRATGVLLDGFHRVRVHQEAGPDCACGLEIAARAVSGPCAGTESARRADSARPTQPRDGSTGGQALTQTEIAGRRLSATIARLIAAKRVFGGVVAPTTTHRPTRAPQPTN